MYSENIKYFENTLIEMIMPKCVSEIIQKILFVISFFWIGKTISSQSNNNQNAEQIMNFHPMLALKLDRKILSF